MICILQRRYNICILKTRYVHLFNKAAPCFVTIKILACQNKWFSLTRRNKPKGKVSFFSNFFRVIFTVLSSQHVYVSRYVSNLKGLQGDWWRLKIEDNRWRLKTIDWRQYSNLKKNIRVIFWCTHDSDSFWHQLLVWTLCV